MAKQEKKENPLQKTIDEIHKNEGEESLKVGIMSGVMKCEVIPTGCISIDYALGVGGFPRGRVIEVFGPESSGKTTLALTVVANAQKAGGVAAYVDAENAIDSEYSQKLGVNLDTLLFSQPDYGEQALRITEKLVKSNLVDIVVVDSVAALVPKDEIDGEVGDAFIGLQARMMSQFLRRLSGDVRKSKTCLVFINQIREKIGGSSWGPNETTPGGRALKFYASVRIDIRRIGSNKEGEKIVSNQTKAKIVKNKVAPPFKIANFDIRFGEGICTAGSLIDAAVLQGIMKKSGTFFSYGATKLGNGKAAAVESLKKDAALAQEIDNKVREILFSNLAVPAEAEEVEGENTAEE